MILNIFMHTLHYENCFLKLNSKFDELVKANTSTQTCMILTHKALIILHIPIQY